MSKRGASDQITRENIGENSDDESTQQHTKASASVMSKRKILKPRGRGLANTGGDQNKDSTKILNGNAFGMTFKPTNQTTPSFGFSSVPPKAVTDKNEQIRALNEKFLERISVGNQKDNVSDFSALCKKYIEYYEKIQSGKINVSDTQIPASVSAPTLAPEPKVSKETNPFSSIKFGAETKRPESEVKPVPTKAASSDSDSESEDEEVKIEGPKFVFESKQPAKKLPFSFGPKPVKKPSSDSDSESEVEIKGPTFTFDKKIDDKVFKLPQKSTQASESNPASVSSTQEKPAFSFGAPNSTNKSNESTEPKPAFSFSKPSGEKNAPFSFTSTASSNGNDAKPAFTFGSESNKSEEVSKPAFSFGSSSNKPEEASKPAFSFGSSSNKSEEASKPAFSFSSSITNDKPAFSFGSNACPKNPEEKPAISFGSSQKADDKPAFSFSAKDTSGKKEDTAFSFGNKSTDSTAEVQKPAFLFSFNPPKNTDATDNKTPAFSFGSSNSSNGGFSFGKANDKPATSVNDNSETVPEEETGGNFEPVAKLPEKSEPVQTGEENENVLYEKRAKLMLFDPSNKDEPYSNRGLGDLKVLKSKENGKSRILVRADGGLRILLNTLISKDMTYSTIGNGSMVRIPTVDPNTKSIETYVLRVKTPTDGQDLLNVLNDAK